MTLYIYTGGQLEESQKRNNRIIYFDILNILACICVVFLHCNGIVHRYSTDTSWKTSLIFEVICYWAVPIFVMLSGATLLKYREKYDTKTFFKKRFTKVLIPWIIWSFIVYLTNKGDLDLIRFAKDFIYCRIESIYWFFPLILYLYCLIPILSILTEKVEHRKILKGIVIYFFVLRSLIYPLCKIFSIKFPTILEYFIGPNAYIMFLLLGYLLSTSELSKKNRFAIYILGIIGILIRYFYTYFTSTNAGVLNRNLFDYRSFVSVFLAVAVFVFIKNINWEKVLNKLHIKPELLTKISNCSFGVYLMHRLIQNNVTKFLGLNMYSIWYRTLGAVALYIICVGIVYILKKIPIIRKAIP